jgi:dTDP-4-dehydrorhamnose reductase
VNAHENGSNSKWLVTGATGFLGANFTPTLGHLTALTRSGHLPVGYDSQVTANLENEQELRAAVRAVKPDYLLHAAAISSHEEAESNPQRAFQINEDATRILAQEAQKVGAKFIYISTDAVFDGATGNYSETDPTNPFSVYGESKLAGEVAAASETNALIVRTNFFGWSPNRTRSILEFFVNNLEANLKVPGFTDFTVTSLYVRRCAEVIRQLATGSTEEGDSNIWHVASTDALTKYEFGVEVANIFELNPELIVAQESPRENTHQVSRSRNISLNTTKTQQFLNRAVLPPLQTQREGIIRARKERTLVP